MSDVMTIYPRSPSFDELLEPQCDGSPYTNDNPVSMQSHAILVLYFQERYDCVMYYCVANVQFHMGFDLQR